MKKNSCTKPTALFIVLAMLLTMLSFNAASADTATDTVVVDFTSWVSPVTPATVQLFGIYGGIDWGGTAGGAFQWGCGTYNGSKCAYMYNQSTNAVIRTISIPDGYVLKSLSLTVNSTFYDADPGKVSAVELSSPGNPTVTFHPNSKAWVQYDTGWTNASRDVTIKITSEYGAGRIMIDNITYEAVLDNTPPVISYEVSPSPNSNGWNKEDVVVHFTASDDSSGVASVTPDIAVTSEGAGQTVTGTVYDVAGNSASADAVINIDKTPPTLTYEVVTVENGGTEQVKVHFIATDALSGIEQVTEDIVLSDEDFGKPLMGTAVDRAGNSTTITATVEPAEPVRYTATIQAGTGGSVVTGVSGSYAAGDKILLAASVNSGYVFDRWSSSGGGTFADTGSASTEFTMPAADVIITAHFLYSGSGTTDTPTPTTPPASKPGASAGGSIELAPVSGGDGTAKTILNAEDFSSALDGATADTNGVKTVKIIVKALAGARQYDMELPAEAVASGVTAQKTELETPEGTVVLPGNMFKSGELPGASSVDISIGVADTSALSEDVKAKIGTRPVIDLKVKVNGESYAWDNPEAPVTVSVNYTPTAEELADPEHIVVWYIDGSGKANAVSSGRYDPSTGKVTFTTTHFSKYAIAFVHKTFTDISASWAKKQIEVLASKGVINGTSATTYGPKLKITRADFITLLIRALGLTAEVTANFDDVKDSDHYYNAVGIAKKLGITTGVGNNKFAPSSPITREDMMCLVANALKAAGKLKESAATSQLDRFSDSTSIASYAKGSVAALVEEGIITGSGNQINPRGYTTREEIAKIIYLIYNK